MSLFDLQPACCRQPLDPRPLILRGRIAPVIRRVIAFDPEAAFSRIAHTADPMKRLQVRSNISLEQLFPKKRDGLCDCGCGQPLDGRKTRWACGLCSEFVWYVYAVIAGRQQEVRRCLRAYYGRKCTGCDRIPPKLPMGTGKRRRSLETDHLIPVHRGGGACWLSNYRPLCIACHRAKTVANRREAIKTF